MWALTISNGALSVTERETPSPGAYDVLVEVRAAGVNAADLLQREGKYPPPPGSPADIPGLELAGVVSAVGDRVVEPLLGRRVAAVVGGGAQATHCVVASEHLLFLPDHVLWEEAGGFPEAFTTAYDALVSQGNLQAGERTLISGATGGVGVAAVQIAHALGAHVTAVTRTIEHHQKLRALGADETVTINEVSSLERVDVVLELLGAVHLDQAQYRLNHFACVVVIGASAGSRVEVDLRNIMVTRSTLTGSTLRSRSREEKADVARHMGAALIPRWSSGELHVEVDRVFELHNGADAYQYFAQRGKLGKVVLRVDK